MINSKELWDQAWLESKGDIDLTNARTGGRATKANPNKEDVPFWNDFIDSGSKPIIQNGYITVPNAPGLGFTLNEDAVKEHLIPEDQGFFEPTSQWDRELSWDRLWS